MEQDGQSYQGLTFGPKNRRPGLQSNSLDSRLQWVLSSFYSVKHSLKLMNFSVDIGLWGWTTKFLYVLVCDCCPSSHKHNFQSVHNYCYHLMNTAVIDDTIRYSKKNLAV